MGLEIVERRAASTGPDIIVIGAMRCATTSLYEMLQPLSGLELTSVKEPDLFLPDEFGKRLPARMKQATRTDAPLVDISPNYSKRHLWPGTARRIHTTNPRARLAYIVRDPVERVISHYNHLVLQGRDMPDPDALMSDKRGRDVIATSRYAYQLEPYLEFWDRDEIVIIDYDELTSAPKRTIAGLMRRFGISCDTRKINGARLNGTQSMRRTPSFWGPLRDSSLGKLVRRNLPHAVNQTVKGTVFSFTPDQPAPPAFTNAARSELKAALREDARAFRKLTGRSFEHWSV